MRYASLSLLGVAICSAAVAAVAWCAYALTRTELCVLAEDSAECTVSSGGLAAAIAALLVVVVPLGSRVFAARQPGGTGLGLLSWGLALVAAGGAALTSSLGTANGTPAETAGYVVGFGALAVGPLMALAGVTATCASPRRARAAQEARRRKLALKAEAEALSARGRPAAPPRPVDRSAEAVGTLAAQLAAIAAARQRVSDDATAAKLRQLDDLRASGLLSADEHAAKRRELLDAL